MAVGDTVKTQRLADRYHVEIQHPGRQWNHIHPPRWEHTTLLAMARRYADQVEQDHPGSEVRIVRTKRVRVTSLRTGNVTELDAATETVTE